LLSSKLKRWFWETPFVPTLFAWRLFRDRLPTKDNLHCRGVLDQASMLCVSGCGLTETSNHLFLHCNILGQFDISLIGGLAHPRLPRFICHTISINSVSVAVSPRCAARFYRLYGLLQCGKSGRKEITGSSMIKYARLFRW